MSSAKFRSSSLCVEIYCIPVGCSVVSLITHSVTNRKTMGDIRHLCSLSVSYWGMGGLPCGWSRTLPGNCGGSLGNNKGRSRDQAVV